MHSQLDYIFLVYGFSFLFMAVVLLTRACHHSERVPWRWMVGFGLLHGLNEWLDLLALDLIDSPSFKLFRICVAATSFLCLIEFGRLGVAGSKPGAFSVRWYLPLALLACLGTFDGLGGLNASVRYTLGLSGAWLSGWCILLESRRQNGNRRLGLRVAAASFMAYGIFSGLITPKAGFFPADFLNHDSFLAWTGTPVQLIRAGLALLSAIGTWIAYRPAESEWQKEKTCFGSLSSYHQWCIPIGFVAILALGFLLVNNRADTIADTMRDGIMDQAGEVADAIDISQINQLSFSPADRNNPVFIRLRNQMKAYAAAASLKDIYSIKLQAGSYYFGPESIDESSPLASAPGTLYEEPQEELREVFTEGRPRFVGPYKDEYGRFVSAYAPIVEPASGEVKLVIGVDIMAEDWESRIAQSRLETISGLACFLVTLLFGGWLLEKRRNIPSELRSVWVRYSEVLLVVVLGCGLTTAAAFLAIDVESRSNEEIFTQLADEQANHILDALSYLRDSQLKSLARFMESSDTPSGERFHDFATSLENNSAVIGFVWAPLVTAGGRKTFERELQIRDFTPLSMSEHPTPKPARPAPVRDFYFPFAHANPHDDNKDILGVDLASNPLTRPALMEAIDTGLPTASAPISLPQFAGHEPGILIFHPINSLDNSGERSGKLSGIIAGYLRINGILQLDDPSPDTTDYPIRLDLFELNHDGKADWLSSLPASAASPAAPVALVQRNMLAPCPNYPFFAFGRSYAISARPTEAFLKEHPARAGYIALGVGLVLTVLLAAFIGTLTDNREALEREVQRRTRRLHESEESYRRQFFDNTAVMWLIDPASGRIADVNPAAIAFYGYTREELVGMKLSNIDTRYESEIQQTLAACLAEGGGRLSLRHRLADRSVHQVEVCVSLIQTSSGPRLHSIISDVSERERAKEDLQTAILDLEAAVFQAREMARAADAANQAKSQFLANMSHEIRTPMNGVLGMLGLMLDSDLTGEHRELAEMAKTSAEALLTVINDILDFSKIESGKFNIAPAPFHVREEIKGVENLLSTAFKQKQIELMIEISDNVPDLLYGDALRIRQVLINLLGNALKFTQSGQAVAMMLDNLGDITKLAQLRFSVIDSGIGIQPQNLARIFEAFQQADLSTTRQFGGTGLGLTISKRLVEMMGGTLNAASQPNVGSVFNFTLPLPILDESSFTSVEQAQESPLIKSSLNILVAEDNPVNQRVVESMLKKAGHCVTLAGDGQQAVDAARKDAFDLILMDVQMPVMDGVSALRAIRSQHGPASEIPVIVLTAHALEGDREKYLAEGFDDYASKPIKRDELLGKIQAVVEKASH